MASDIINFRCPDGRRVWKNVHDAMDLLSGAESYHILRGESRSQAKRELALFLLFAAFRHAEPEMTVLRSLKRLNHIDANNPHIYKVYCVGRSRAIHFDPDLREEPLPVGRLDGLTVIRPVTANAFGDSRIQMVPPTSLTHTRISFAAAEK